MQGRPLRGAGGERELCDSPEAFFQKHWKTLGRRTGKYRAVRNVNTISNAMAHKDMLIAQKPLARERLVWWFAMCTANASPQLIAILYTEHNVDILTCSLECHS